MVTYYVTPFAYLLINYLPHHISSLCGNHVTTYVTPTMSSLSKLHLILRATAPVGGGDGVLSKLLLVLRVDRRHQKYSSV